MTEDHKPEPKKPHPTWAEAMLEYNRKKLERAMNNGTTRTEDGR